MNLRAWPRLPVVNSFHNSRRKLNKTSGVDPRFLNLLKNCICKENSPNQDLAYSTRFLSPQQKMVSALICKQGMFSYVEGLKW